MASVNVASGQAEVHRATTAAEVAAAKLDTETKAKEKAQEETKDRDARLAVESTQRAAAERRARRLPVVVAAAVLMAIIVTGSAVTGFGPWSLEPG